MIDSVTGVLNWSPPAEANLGEFEVEITVTDAGQPAESDRRTLTLRLTDDNALYTYFVGSVVHNGVREAWLYDRSTNQRTVVHEGEEFRIADLTGKVTRITEDAMDVESGEHVYRLELGQNLRGWTPTEGTIRPVNTDDSAGSNELRGT
jgi:hypothetical protein